MTFGFSPLFRPSYGCPMFCILWRFRRPKIPVPTLANWPNIPVPSSAIFQQKKKKKIPHEKFQSLESSWWPNFSRTTIAKKKEIFEPNALEIGVKSSKNKTKPNKTSEFEFGTRVKYWKMWSLGFGAILIGHFNVRPIDATNFTVDKMRLPPLRFPPIGHVPLKCDKLTALEAEKMFQTC